jgi:hypothetical protein
MKNLPCDVLKQGVEVRRIANFPRIRQDLIKVPGLGHGGDDLLRRTGLSVDTLS